MEYRKSIALHRKGKQAGPEVIQCGTWRPSGQRMLASVMRMLPKTSGVSETVTERSSTRLASRPAAFSGGKFITCAQMNICLPVSLLEHRVEDVSFEEFRDSSASVQPLGVRCQSTGGAWSSEAQVLDTVASHIGEVEVAGVELGIGAEQDAAARLPPVPHRQHQQVPVKVGGFAVQVLDRTLRPLASLCNLSTVL